MDSSGPASGLEVICEPQGLGNLAPSRSRLFKLNMKGKEKYVELQQATSIYGGYPVRKREREEEAKRERESRNDQAMGAPKVGEGSDYQLVTPSMRLYLLCVEARLRGITALKAMSQVR